LGGTLTLALDGSFVPASSDVFTVFDSLSFTGAFSNVSNGQRLFTAGNEGSFVVTYNAGAGDVILSNFALNIGDYSGNGFADSADYVTWREGPSPTLAAYALWREHFGQSAGSGAGLSGVQLSAAPEPSAMLLLFCGLASAICARLRYSNTSEKYHHR